MNPAIGLNAGDDDIRRSELERQSIMADSAADMIVTDPFQLFAEWMSEAARSEIDDASAMSLATVGEGGMPSVRIVLLKGVDRRGFVFYTNLNSRKGRQLRANPKAALCFHWKSVARQVRIEGSVELISDAEADTYYASRPRGSRIGAWASMQSEPLESREVLERQVAETDARFPGETVPRPPFWSGFRVVPERIEFWRDGAYRLHDRIEYLRDGDGWSHRRLYP